jgi:hypothetical protein
MNIIVRYCGLAKRAVWQGLVETKSQSIQAYEDKIRGNRNRAA